ncbi:MAG: hypothetical protein EBU46_10730 [Nitrosomonadaceae bacterium]|nr:hypothetical protein [Nitrosomonadaceae bacterium]
MATDTTGVGTARTALAAASYGGDKGIFGFGSTSGTTGGLTTLTNLVSNTGVVATDVTNASATARWYLAAAGFGGDHGPGSKLEWDGRRRAPHGLQARAGPFLPDRPRQLTLHPVQLNEPNCPTLGQLLPRHLYKIER